ncbi:MAG: elongation factor Tu [Candidatus Aenigmarchaeota archaeon]|nr:elongation factor Tu [Candidatus Aenigmarchaeota archaeon]
MQSVNFTLLGDESIANNLGKKGTSTDITIYDRKDSDTIRTFTCPTSFPEKIQSIFQAINMGEYVIMHVTKVDKFLGEQILALDILKKTRGLLCHSYDVDRNKLLEMVKGTVVEKYKIVDISDLKKEVDAVQPMSNEGDAKIAIDHCFDVKGAGTVILGRVIQGKIKQYDNLKLLLDGTDVMLKSIQMHDENIAEAVYPARVGLSVKGVTSFDVERGDVLCAKDAMKVLQEITLDYSQNKYFKEDIRENQSFLISIGLQTRGAKVLSLNPMKLSLVKPVAFDEDDICVVLKPESQTMRIVGSGRIVDA